jgi:hypothetical protein
LCERWSARSTANHLIHLPARWRRFQIHLTLF